MELDIPTVPPVVAADQLAARGARDGRLGRLEGGAMKLADDGSSVYIFPHPSVARATSLGTRRGRARP